MDSSASLAFWTARTTELEHWSSVDASWLKFWTFLVVVGVALELLLILINHHAELNEFRRGLLRPPDRPKAAKLIVELFGAALVTVGVACELFVTSNIDSISAELRKIAEQQISFSNQRAANAVKESAGANARTLREIDARVALEKDFLWRGPRDVLIRASESIFKRRLSRFAGQGFRISVCNPEPDAITPQFREPNLAIGAMKRALIKAGWKIDDWPGHTGGFPYTTRPCTTPGMLVGVRKDATDAARNAACSLQRTVNEILVQETPPGRTTCWIGTTTLVVPPTPNGAPSPAMLMPPEEVNIEAGPHPAFRGNPFVIAPP